MAVHRDRIGALDSGRQFFRPGRQPGEQPEGAVHVQPRAMFFGQIGQRFDRIEIARVYLAGVPHQDGGDAFQPAKRLVQSRQIEPADRVPLHAPHRRTPHSEHR